LSSSCCLSRWGLLMRTRYEGESEVARPIMREASSLSLAALMVLSAAQP